MYYIHKYEVAQCYGGPEEGGWWYDSGVPADGNTKPCAAFEDEERAYKMCCELNAVERDRAEKEEDYDYYSVLSYRSRHFAYDVSEDPVAKPYPERQPHYE